jgi:hypothetical protein
MSDVSWSLVDDGATLGQTGSENGVILCDEEHRYGARITLEQGGTIAPFSITCGVYGVMVHTRFFADEAEGQIAYDLMKPGLAAIAEGEASEAPESASAFVTQFP